MADTDLFAVMGIVQAPVPVHAPDQAVKVYPESAVAVTVTGVPVVYSEQLVPQDVPAGSTVTVPLPVLEVFNLYLTAFCENDAVTDLFEFICTTQLPEPVQSPDQPAKVQSLAGVAVKVTGVPVG